VGGLLPSHDNSTCRQVHAKGITVHRHSRCRDARRVVGKCGSDGGEEVQWPAQRRLRPTV